MAKIDVTKPSAEKTKAPPSAFSGAFQKAVGSDIAKITEASKQLPLPKGVQRDELRAKEVGKIQWRLNPTRRVSLAHAIDLAQSIVAVGLIEPIAVDRNWQLLAGGHRLFALHLLAMPPSAREAALAGELGEQLSQEKARGDSATALGELPHLPELRFPIHRMEEVDSVADPKRALDIEVTENEKRRDYRPDEIIELSHQLKEAGYSFARGRKVDGGKSGQQAIQLIIGKSSRTVHRILNPEPQKPASGSKVRNFRPETVIEWIEAHPKIDIIRGILAAAEKRVKELEAS